ncbi:MAG: hypothetical protein ACHWZW_22340 [Spirulina sp.]
MNRPIRPAIAIAAAVALGLLVLAAGSRDEFPRRRQGGGSQSANPIALLSA